MNCPACGTDNRERARFCRDCGTPLPGGPEAEVPAAEGLVEIPTGEALPTGAAFEPLAGEPRVEADLASLPDEEPDPELGQAEFPVGEAEVDLLEADIEEVLETEAGEPQAADHAGSSPSPSVDEAEQDAPAASGPSPEATAEVELDQAHEGDGALEAAASRKEGTEPFEPLPSGTLIGDRFMVVEALVLDEDAESHRVLYRTRDLRRCWHCGHEGNAADEAFCSQCGASMDRKMDARLLQVEQDDVELSASHEVTGRLQHGEHTFLILAEPEPEQLPELQSIRLLVGQRSDAGQVRELDEDSLLAMTLSPTFESQTAPVLGLFAVADGMGGHDSGEVASSLALQVLAERAIRYIILPELSDRSSSPEEIVGSLEDAVLAANDAVYLARQKRGSDMGTTVTAALVRTDRLFLAHVGDCRAYLWNSDGLDQLTIDHSVVARMIADGQAEPDEIYTHPHRSVIYRSIGDKPLVDVDTAVLPLEAGDRLILCSDGLWEMVYDEGIEDVMMQESDPQLACDQLVKRANLAGGEDNISVIVVQVEAF
jgi:serine/threonine protein phosphatase PrpC